MKEHFRIIKAASSVPELRFGQFLFNAVAFSNIRDKRDCDLFYFSDIELANICEDYARFLLKEG